ncbi:5'-cyclic phosphodiesterase pde-1 [Durusdinium trenchii]|uniref:5'-cyclic phosphodiesterase pde-1 n=1 Tax=Durusdinium trenchii TaxID=1381693 RepID=A0ABP0IB53_9DINO
MSSYRDMDPNSPKAIAARAACVQKFLERHGFLEVNTPRNTSDVHQKVHMEPVYPLDVAEEMGNERMVSFLLQLGFALLGKPFHEILEQIDRVSASISGQLPESQLRHRRGECGVRVGVTNIEEEDGIHGVKPKILGFAKPRESLSEIELEQFQLGFEQIRRFLALVTHGPFPVAERWAELVLKEFALQGEEEKALGIPVGPLNDKKTVNMPLSQIGFIEFVVAPLALAMARVLPPVWFTNQMIIAALADDNANIWMDRWIEDTLLKPSLEEQVSVRERIHKMVQRTEQRGFTATMAQMES